jgi:hypothetical protein
VPLVAVVGLGLILRLMWKGVEQIRLRLVSLVGVPRFELGASWSQTRRSDLTELHPERH